ncbi:MAG: tRNA lysidine(34) synthetase TilS [Bacteroidota bacterium]
MLRAFHDHIAHHNLFAKTDRILVAVSGGRDSMVLAELFRQSDFAFGVAHANFQLRGSSSDGDEVFVKNWCAKHRVPFYTRRFETTREAKDQGLSTQMAARELRYAWFNELCEEQGFAFVATAHHQQDSLETTLLNLVRGTGHVGIAGIFPSSGNRIRPLLFATRAEITAFAEDQEVPWREDASNAETKYLRNYVRHEIIPKLGELNSNVLNTFQGTKARLQGAAEQLNAFLDDWLYAQLDVKGKDISLKIKSLQALKAPAVLLYHWLQRYDFLYGQTEELIKHLKGIPGRVWKSPTHQVLIDRELLILSPIVEKHQPQAWDAEQPEQIFPEGQIRRESMEFNGQFDNDENQAWLQESTLQKPWVLRPWQEGDRFVPLGMLGQKKLSDFLIDRKIPLNLKSRVWVLEIGGEIAWVIGHRLDDRFKLSPQTQQAVQVRFTPE